MSFTPILLLKLCLVPALIYAVSLAGRRWGAGVAGWISALPIVAGPPWRRPGPEFALAPKVKGGLQPPCRAQFFATNRQCGRRSPKNRAANRARGCRLSAAAPPAWP